MARLRSTPPAQMQRGGRRRGGGWGPRVRSKAGAARGPRLSNRPGETEAEAVDPEDGVADAAKRGTRALRAVGSRPAADDTVVVVDRSTRDCARSESKYIGVPAPLTHVPRHVVQIPLVGLLLTHVVCASAWVAVVPCDFVELTMFLSGCAGSAGVLPLRLGWQPVAVGTPVTWLGSPAPP